MQQLLWKSLITLSMVLESFNLILISCSPPLHAVCVCSQMCEYVGYSLQVKHCIQSSIHRVCHSGNNFNTKQKYYTNILASKEKTKQNK